MGNKLAQKMFEFQGMWIIEEDDGDYLEVVEKKKRL